MTAELDRGIEALKIEFGVELASGDISHLGTYNCRRKNNTATGPWSEHAWPNAVDVMLRDWPGRNALGDRIAAWMRQHPELWSEVFWEIPFHWNHVHGTANPRRNYDNQQVPPCAGGDDMPLSSEDLDAIEVRMRAVMGPTGTIIDPNGNARPFHQYTVNGVWHAVAGGKRMMDHLLVAGASPQIIADAVIANLGPSLAADVADEIAHRLES